MCVLCLSLYILCFFFFKQKTAYEMRISDWSSDVCSSDLGQSYDSDRGRPPRPARPLAAPHLVHPPSGPAKMSGPVVGEAGNAGCILAAGGAFAVLFGAAWLPAKVLPLPNARPIAWRFGRASGRQEVV